MTKEARPRYDIVVRAATVTHTRGDSSMNHAAPGALRRRLITDGSITAVAALAFTGCASSDTGGDTTGGDGETISVSLITKTSTNPFFVAMQDGAEAAADDLGVELSFAAGKEDGDEDSQIQAI